MRSEQAKEVHLDLPTTLRVVLASATQDEALDDPCEATYELFLRATKNGSWVEFERALSF